MTKRESLRKPHPDSSYCCWSSEKQVWALKRNWIITRGWKSESDTCLRAHVVLGLCGGLRRVAEGVCVDRGAGDGTLSRSRLELRNSGVVPSGCLIQVAANTHDKPEQICICDVTATWWMGSTRHTWAQTCSTCTTRCACASARWSRAARLVLPWPLTGERADGPWMKPTETTPVAKPVGTFSARLQLISQSCSVDSPVFTFLLLLMLLGWFFLKRDCDRNGNKTFF